MFFVVTNCSAQRRMSDSGIFRSGDSFANHASRRRLRLHGEYFNDAGIVQIAEPSEGSDREYVDLAVIAEHVISNVNSNDPADHYAMDRFAPVGRSIIVTTTRAFV